MPRYYPINLSLENKKCMVVGAGTVAERKVRRLLECGARVFVVSPAVTHGLKAMADKGKIIYRRKKIHLRDLNGAHLVIAATTDRSVNSAVSSYCHRKNILVNIVDSPGECSFILPSLIRRGDLTISISTNGISPALSKKIRLDIEKRFGAEYAALLRMMKKIRPQARKKIKSMRSRREYFNKIFQPKTLKLLKQKRFKQCQKLIFSKYTA